MRRSAQQMSAEECIAVLESAKRGVLAVNGDGGYPYGVPMDHYYDPADGRIYFHGAREGHKQDAIAACNKVCYTVLSEGVRAGDDWPLHFDSVIVFGRIRIVEDPEKRDLICRRIIERFTDDPVQIEWEVNNYANKARCLELIPEHMSGKHVKES